MELDLTKLKIMAVKSYSLKYQELHFVVRIKDIDTLRAFWHRCMDMSNTKKPQNLYCSSILKSLKSTNYVVPAFVWASGVVQLYTYEDHIHAGKSVPIYIGGAMLENLTKEEVKTDFNDIYIEHKLTK